MRPLVLIFLAILIFPATIMAADDFVYPYDNPYQATVYGTPPELVHKIDNPVKPKLRSIRIKGRQMPSVFSYSSEMYYSTALQKGEAPLIFIIAGTGAEHDSAKMTFLVRVDRKSVV